MRQRDSLLKKNMPLKIVQKRTSHKASRRGLAPLAIVIHIAEGSISSVDGWFASPASKVSAHYCVRKDGVIHQYVDEAMAAFHAGTRYAPVARIIRQNGATNPNFYTIGIEHEGKATDEWTAAMFEASAELIADIALRHNIPIDADHIIPHRAIRQNKVCPGYKVDLKALIATAQAKALIGKCKVSSASVPATSSEADAAAERLPS